jgi:hypothetical protein
MTREGRASVRTGRGKIVYRREKGKGRASVESKRRGGLV